MKVKCIICEKEFEIYEMFCLRSCRGANSICTTLNCPLICPDCLINLKKCLESINECDYIEKLKEHLIKKMEKVAEDPEKPLKHTFLNGDFYTSKYNEIIEKIKEGKDVAKIFIEEFKKCESYDELITILAILFELAIKKWFTDNFIIIKKDDIMIPPIIILDEFDEYGGDGVAF